MTLAKQYLIAAAFFCAVAGLRADSGLPGDMTGTTDNDPRIITDCISSPSETHRVTFQGSPDGIAIIKDVKVQPGDVVKKGDILMTEDTDQAYAQLAVLKAAADATGAVQEQDATIKSKNTVLDMLNKSIHSEMEILTAQLDRDVAVARKKQAEEEYEQRKLQYQLQLIKIQDMTLRSPIDGVVEQVNLFSGEAVDANSDKEGAVYIVNNNPLWVDIQLDDQRAEKLKLHDTVEVQFPFEEGRWRNAEVIFLSPELNYVGQTRTVRLSVPNPDNHPAKQRLTVRLPESVVADDGAAVGLAKP
ncbi:MAG TPA: efflux RND transporter periplasmic adaptor subunit [Tepidisphaeraceae bacterium]|nr:efflux RND transporter periplasmic adaptor subunit [Tepidisphaeraceae bacterium]